jgi:hypothetical protein
VVEEANPGGNVVLARPVEIQGEGDVGFTSLTVNSGGSH